MAIGTKGDFTLYHDEFHDSFFERLARNTNAFNAASNNALMLSSEIQLGDYAKRSFFKNLGSSVIRRRDPSSVSASTPDALIHAEEVSVKIRSGAHVENTLDGFRAIGFTEDDFSMQVGEQVAELYGSDMISNAIRGLSSAVPSSLDVNTTAVTTNLRTQDLTAALKLFGDKANNIVAWLMHSGPYWDIVQGQIDTHAQFRIAENMLVYGGGPGTFDRPVIVVDDPLLIDAAGGTGASSGEDIYHVYGLAAGSVRFKESEQQELLFETVGGLDNLVKRFQWEAAANMTVKGYSWDITNGGSSPDNTALAAAGNWDKVATSDKDTAGVRILCRSGA